MPSTSARETAGEFSEKEIALAKTFADQAVIAIQNARLFQELQAKNRELTEALEQQTATAEILRRLVNSSGGDACVRALPPPAAGEQGASRNP